MFDRAFFETELPKHVTEKARFAADGSVTVRLHLANGEMLSVISVKTCGDGYVVVEILPRNGKLRPHDRDERRQGAPPYDLDRLAIPFGVITEVEITSARMRNQKLGFVTE